MLGSFTAAALLGLPTLFAQILPFQGSDEDLQPTGVSVPLFPFIIAVAGLAAVVLISIGALRMPRPRRRHREPPPPRKERPKPIPIVEAPPPPPPTVAPVYKKAPVSAHFPMIKPEFPDVWGLEERGVIVFRVEDKGLLGQREIPGLKAYLDEETIPLVFFRGEARIERSFHKLGPVDVAVELKVKGERQPRRTTRVLKIVDYRTEIADLFATFKDAASQSITRLRVDSTPWEIYDLLLDANSRLSQAHLRTVVASFEEAKFSNHPVGRATYEKMLLALRALNVSGE